MAEGKDAQGLPSHTNTPRLTSRDPPSHSTPAELGQNISSSKDKFATDLVGEKEKKEGRNRKIAQDRFRGEGAAEDVRWVSPLPHGEASRTEGSPPRRGSVQSTP